LIAENSAASYWQAAAFNVLSDNTKAPADQLPDTGMSTELEQTLSSVYIEPVSFGNADISKPTYGTRTQSILTLRQEKGKGAELTAYIVSREYPHSIDSE
jgi:uncharacterized protein with NRDE domain